MYVLPPEATKPNKFFSKSGPDYTSMANTATNNDTTSTYDAKSLESDAESNVKAKFPAPVNKKQTRRSYSKKIKVNQNNNNNTVFTVIGQNAASLQSKK